MNPLTLIKSIIIESSNCFRNDYSQLGITLFSKYEYYKTGVKNIDLVQIFLSSINLIIQL